MKTHWQLGTGEEATSGLVIKGNNDTQSTYSGELRKEVETGV